MWIELETRELVNIELLNNIVPTHRDKTASGYAAAVLIVADSKRLYCAVWPNGELSENTLTKAADKP